MNTNLRMPKGSFARFSARGCRVVGLAVIAATSTPSLVRAQQTAAPAARDQGASSLETVVVTGTAIAGGVRKLEASYNIVTANEEEIRQSNPKSTADLLKISPGMWPESTGGQTGANIEIAGFPGGGDAPYFTTLLMGSPVYGMPTLSFFETTTISGSTTPSGRWKSCKAARQSYLPAARWAPPPISFSRRAADDPSGSLGRDLWR